jgi:phosphatidylserine decarboxylase
MEPIYYIDRLTGKQEIESVYQAEALEFIYGDQLINRFFGKPLLHLLIKRPLFSWWYGFLQHHPSSKKKIIPFIEKFQVDTSEFQDPVDSFCSFNDFFIRKLKKECRPIVEDDAIAVMPADARYRFYQNINTTEGFIVKGEKFNLSTLLQNEKLAEKYSQGSMVMARLCPTDYHRFHFPCDGIAGKTDFINGWLYSVNPCAVKKNIQIYTENKRTLCTFDTKYFGKVLFLEIGATAVGSISHTYSADSFQKKGGEKGFFSFGASALILLFEPNRITFDKDLLETSGQGLEIRCLMGQRMGSIQARP